VLAKFPKEKPQKITAKSGSSFAVFKGGFTVARQYFISLVAALGAFIACKAFVVEKLGWPEWTIIRIAYIIGRSASLPSMWIVRLLSLGATMLLILNLASTSAAGQAPAAGQRVLMLYSDERLLPANIIMDEAIRAAFSVGTKNRVEFYSEFLDVACFQGEEQQKRQRDFFRDKYRVRPPDLVIAPSGGALVFLAEHRGELFAGVPIVYCSFAGDPHPNLLSDARIAEVAVPYCVAPTLEMMLRLHPDTRQVAVVSGSGPAGPGTGSWPKPSAER